MPIAVGSPTIRSMFHRVGLRLAKKLGRKWLYGLELSAALHIAVATIIGRWVDLGRIASLAWPVGALVPFTILQLASKAQTEDDREQRETAVKRANEMELAALRRHKSYTAGNLAALLRSLIEETDHDPAAVRSLQVAFLSHAVDVARDYLGISKLDDRLAATWVIPIDSYTKWKTVAYDRNRIARQPGRVRAIAPGIPGAADAFLTGNTVLIPDTTAADVAKYFDAKPSYRAILSVPARTMHVSKLANVTIDGHPDNIVGVLNVDCTETNTLRPELAEVLYDIAYLIGILEHLGGGAHV